MLIEYVRNEGRAEGMAKGKAEGKAECLRAKALEAARKMREHGIAWDIVTDATGLKPEDLADSV